MIALLAFWLLAAPDRPRVPFDTLAAPTPFSMRRLDLELEIDYQRESVRGSAVLRLHNSTRRPAAVVPLLLGRLMRVSRIEDGAGAAVSFQQRVTQFEDDSALQVNVVAARLRRPVAPGDSMILRIHYAGILVGYTETGSLYIQDRVSPEFTILRVDAYAFPQSGVPSWRLNRMAPDEPFRFSTRIRVPAGLVVASGGTRLPPERRDSTVTWRFVGTEPVPFLNIAIAPYRTLENDGATIYHFAADSVGAARVATAIAAALRRYRELFGPIGEDPRLTVIEIPEGFGSQASLTAGIIQTADAFRDRSQLRQLYHELSHLWNAPDRDQPSSRWNEGLATFLQWRTAAELDSAPPVAARVERTVHDVLERCGRSGRCRDAPLVRYGVEGMTDLSYPVGMLMFAALFEVMGDRAFDQTYRDFFQAHRAGGARVGDLVDAFRRADPRTIRVFDDWLTSTRWYPRLLAGESMADLVAVYARP